MDHLESFLKELQTLLPEGPVETDIGTFYGGMWPADEGRNPKTSEKVVIPGQPYCYLMASKQLLREVFSELAASRDTVLEDFKWRASESQTNGSLVMTEAKHHLTLAPDLFQAIIGALRTEQMFLLPGLGRLCTDAQQLVFLRRRASDLRSLKDEES